MAKTGPPIYPTCNENYSIKHIIVHYSNFNEARKDFNIPADNLYETIVHFPTTKTLFYNLKKIESYNNIQHCKNLILSTKDNNLYSWCLTDKIIIIIIICSYNVYRKYIVNTYRCSLLSAHAFCWIQIFFFVESQTTVL